ncbi:serine/threonine-protein kinase [Fodinibius sediminis]|nr:serine/threonine-protein kinase [Fodinibius sediminis]
MDKKRWKKISHIFDLALTLPQNRRTSYIRSLCTGDAELQQEVLSLLASVEESGRMLNDHLHKNQALLQELIQHLEQEPPSRSLIDTTLGQWHITNHLGYGGMGDVYQVKRCDSDIHQRGALKIIRRGLDTPENLRRFRVEKQILAGLHHPNMANLIDSGISGDGLPYLVMELIEGVPIDQFCDQHNLTISERLDLFKTVCHAVQYAHKNLVVHRDLKPENILVTDDGHVKILDFGIAKLLDPDLYGLSTVKTSASMRLMSLDYAAPEQISGQPVTTSTDVYALGVLLHNLVTGLHPYDLSDKTFRAAEQVVLCNLPSLPSHRLKKADDLSPIASSRNTRPAKLIHTVRGDLDAIILKALNKEADRRYSYAIQLVEDLSRFETNKPVTARLQTSRYHVTKFLIRHKKRIATAGAALLIIIALTSFYTVQLAHERNEARLEAQKAAQVKNLMVDIFQSGDPFHEPDAKNLSMSEVLDQGTKRIASSLEDQPLIKADLQEALGGVYSGLVRYAKAEPLLRNALEVYQQELGANHPQIADVSHSLGFLLMRRGHYSEAETLFERARDIYEDHYGDEDPHYAYVVRTLAFLYSETNRTGQALANYKRAIKIYVKNNDPDVAETLTDMGYLLMDLGRLGEAQMNLQQAIALFNKYEDESNIEIANAYTGLGQVLHLRGALLEAEIYHRKALRIRLEIFEPGHTHIASSQLRLGWLLIDQGRFKEAVPLVQKAYKSFINHLPPDHWKVAATEGVLALAWIGQGKFQQAERTLLNTHTALKEQFGPDDWRTRRTQQALDKLYTVWPSPQQAQNFLEE